MSGYATIQDESKNGIRRQLVQVLLRDALRRHGIPAAWVELQMQVSTSNSKGPGMHVRLILTHWDERVLRYAIPFQKSLQADIIRFEPLATEWLHGIFWQLDTAQDYPYGGMPDRAFWGVDGKHRSYMETQPMMVPATALAAAAVASTADIMLPPVELFSAVPSAPAVPEVAPLSPALVAAMATEQAKADEKAQALQDVEMLMRIRDEELGLQQPGDENSGFAATQTFPASEFGDYEATQPIKTR